MFLLITSQDNPVKIEEKKKFSSVVILILKHITYYFFFFAILFALQIDFLCLSLLRSMVKVIFISKCTLVRWLHSIFTYKYISLTFIYIFLKATKSILKWLNSDVIYAWNITLLCFHNALMQKENFLYRISATFVSYRKD